MRRIEVFDKRFKKWMDVPMETIGDGDIFRIFDGDRRHIDGLGNNVWVATGDSYMNENGVIIVDTVY